MRKPKLTYEMVDRAVALKKDGLSNDDIIKALGIHKSTFYRWLKDAEERAGGCKRALNDSLKAEVEYKKSLLVSIRNASMKPQHWTAAAWLLERKYPMEFGKAGRLEEEADEPVQLTLGLELEVMGEGESDGGGAGADPPSVGIDGALSVGVAARPIYDEPDDRGVAGGDVANAVSPESATPSAGGGGAGTRDPGGADVGSDSASSVGFAGLSRGASPGGYASGGYWDGGSDGGFDACDFDDYWDGGE